MELCGHSGRCTVHIYTVVSKGLVTSRENDAIANYQACKKIAGVGDLQTQKQNVSRMKPKLKINCVCLAARFFCNF